MQRYMNIGDRVIVEREIPFGLSELRTSLASRSASVVAAAMAQPGSAPWDAVHSDARARTHGRTQMHAHARMDARKCTNTDTQCFNGIMISVLRMPAEDVSEFQQFRW